jgi:hypothetical protein
METKIRIWDEQPGSYFRELRKIFGRFKYLNSLMQIGIEKFGSGIRDGKKKIGSGIRDRNTGRNSIYPGFWKLLELWEFTFLVRETMSSSWRN